MDNVYNDINEITDKVYLGDLLGAFNVEKLKSLGIKKVLSVIIGSFSKYKESDNIIQKTIWVNDVPWQNIIKYFGECLNFIKGDDKVLVHCAVGASRSATVVIAYIMWTKKMSFKEALEFVRSKRFVVSPNFGFIDQLKLFEKLLVENNYDIDKIKFEEIKWEPKAHYDFDI